jgi:hypothetical protein
MVSSVNAKFMAVEKEKKRQRTLAKQQAKEGVITPPEVVLETSNKGKYFRSFRGYRKCRT